MSRVGKLPVPVPKGVEINVAAASVSVKGPLGTLTQPLTANVRVKKDGDELVVETANDSNEANAMSGTLRAILANMVTGVTKGFERKLTLVGVGYRAQAQGDKLNLTLGFSHPVVHQMPKGVTVRDADPDRDPDQGHRQASGRPGRRDGAGGPPARAVQGQGRALRRRDSGHQGNQEEVGRSATMIDKT